MNPIVKNELWQQVVSKQPDGFTNEWEVADDTSIVQEHNSAAEAVETWAIKELSGSMHKAPTREEPAVTGASQESSNIAIDPRTLKAPTKKDPPQVEPEAATSTNPFATNLSAAMYWYGYGFEPLPIITGTKQPATKLEPWRNGLDSKKTFEYWIEHPNHEVAVLIPENIIVFDADGSESVAALTKIETEFGISPKLVVRTTKGEHHYYRRAEGTIAKTSNYCTERHPERLDVKTGTGYMLTVPSTGKSILVNEAASIDNLSEVTQDFIDAISRHNGQMEPSEPKTATSKIANHYVEEGTALPELENLLNCISPDCGYDDWTRTGMAIFHETKGSDEGFALFDSWSSAGKKYKGIKEIETKWKSFRLDTPTPVTIGTLVMLAKKTEEFTICDFEVIESQTGKTGDSSLPENNVVAATTAPTTVKRTGLDRYSLQGQSEEIGKTLVADVCVLDELALMGQATMIYAAPNTGKTLITLQLLADSIRNNRIDPSKTYYLNMDDSSKGLYEKLQFAEEYGFHMLAEGYKDFKASAFVTIIEKMIANNEAHDAVVIMDTFKKFANLMDKSLTSSFTRIIRSFVMNRGTVIALGHINKKRNNGKPVYAGTTDIIDDFDCAYTIDTIHTDLKKEINVVEFSNCKKRGDVALTAYYRYSTERDISYNELLSSVQKVDADYIDNIEREEAIKGDSEIINVIKICIAEGTTSKMLLAETTAERAKCSKKQAIRIIEKYTGNDPSLHHWEFVVGERGAKLFKTLETPQREQQGDSTTP